MSRTLNIYVYKIEYKRLTDKVADIIRGGKITGLGFGSICKLLFRLMLCPGQLKRMTEYAREYGLHADVLTIEEGKDSTYVKRGDSAMLTVSATIGKIDYGKILDAIKPAGGSRDSTTIDRIMQIIQPFIADTLETIPHSAMAELFMLLGREQVMKLAEEFGIRLSDLSVTSE
jgi:hypothetical protein